MRGVRPLLWCLLQSHDWHLELHYCSHPSKTLSPEDEEFLIEHWGNLLKKGLSTSSNRVLPQKQWDPVGEQVCLGQRLVYADHLPVRWCWREYEVWSQPSTDAGSKGLCLKKDQRPKLPNTLIHSWTVMQVDKFIPRVIPLGQTMLSVTRALRSPPLRPPLSILAGVPQSVQNMKLQHIGEDLT